ncbi:hypothetical protein SDC9_133786 [bioreactor metagenome]|uniref:BT-3044-like C-terminal domain-containing protein n=2 Tax=root TaxID=1 RepID=A0A645DBX8_9ZZZZ
MSGTKLVHPLAKDKVRMFIGNELYNDDTTPQDIARKSVVVQINADSTVVVSPYDSSMMEVEMLSNAPGYNRYNPSLVQGLTKQRVLWLNYRFRQKNVTTGEFGSWRDVEERLIRIEE